MKRLYLRIYLAVLASLFAFALLIGGAWYLAQRGADRPSWGAHWGVFAAQVAAELLPEDAARDALVRSLERWHERTGASLALFARDGTLVAPSSHPSSFPICPMAAGWWSRDCRRRGRSGGRRVWGSYRSCC